MSSLSSSLRRFVRFYIRGRKPVGRVQRRCATVRLGSSYGGWAICPEGLTADSVVYCFGVGEDASFDTAMIERFGVTVHAFDPTPRSAEWVQTERTAERLPERFRFNPIGIADYDGEAEFFPPADPTHVSHSMLHGDAPSGAAIRVPVRRLRSIMAERSHDRIDLLKMDIEGAEFDVIRSIVEDKIPVQQLLVEFHYHTVPNGRGRTAESIRLLNDAGLTLFHIAESGLEYSFRRF